MFSKPIKLWGNGAITIPKKWREKWGTDSFMLEENAKGYLVIKPISFEEPVEEKQTIKKGKYGNTEDIDYVWYENVYDPEDNHYHSGFHFPGGIAPDVLLTMWREASEEIEKEDQSSDG